MNLTGRRKRMQQRWGWNRTWRPQFELRIYWAEVRTYNANVFTWSLQLTEMMVVVDNGAQFTPSPLSPCRSLSLFLPEEAPSSAVELGALRLIHGNQLDGRGQIETDIGDRRLETEKI